MQWLKKSLIRRIGLFLTVFVISIFFIYGFISIQLMSDFFEEKSKTELLKDAQQIVTEIDKFLGENIVIVDQMKTNQDYFTVIEEIKSQDEKRRHPLFDRVTQELQTIQTSEKNINLAYIAIVQANDLITSDYTFDSEPDYNMSKRDWYIETINAGGATITKPYIDLVTGQMVVSVTTPIVQNSQTLGAFGIDLSVEDIYAMMQSYQVGTNGYTLLLNKDGGVFYSPSQSADIHAPKTDNYNYLDTFKAEIFSGQSGVVEYADGNNDQYIAYVPTEKANWIVVTVIPKSEVLAPLYQFIFINLLIFLISLFIIVFLIRNLTNLISKPIVTICNEIESFSKDDQEMDIPESFYFREDEIGVLAKGLHAMSHRITHYIEEVEINNTTLNLEIENRKHIQARLELILELLAGTDEGIFILDHKFNCIYNNSAFSEIIGFPESKIQELNLLENNVLIDASLVEKLNREMVWTGEIEYSHPTSPPLFLLFKIIKVEKEENHYYIGHITNLTARKQIEKDFHYLKYFDYLTKLNNKLFLDENATALINADTGLNSRHALILVNIDNFRIINEAKGFEFGNKVIITLANRLKNLVSEHDILARLGNDEFGIFKTHIHSNKILYEYIMELAQDLRKIYFFNEEELIIDVNIGISLYPNDAANYPSLFKTASSALNNVIEDKERVFDFYNENFNNLSIFKYEMQNKLKSALIKEEFMVYYQPQFDMLNNTIVGVEALIRWQSPSGMIPPNSFIPIAEESHLIIPIGEWVLLIACEFGNKLHEMGYSIPIAVNLSKLQFKSSYICELVQSILDKTNLPPHLLELEITEGILMDNEDECESILKNFNAMGILIAIDDFGTGYSSLSYLNKFAVDKIKIDRSFIKNIPTSDNGIIAKVIIELAGNFNLQVIAEGVETVEQIDFLLKNNCQIAQGFFYAKPMSETELITFIEKKLANNH